MGTAQQVGRHRRESVQKRIPSYRLVMSSVTYAEVDEKRGRFLVIVRCSKPYV